MCAGQKGLTGTQRRGSLGSWPSICSTRRKAEISRTCPAYSLRVFFACSELLGCLRVFGVHGMASPQESISRHVLSCLKAVGLKRSSKPSEFVDCSYCIACRRGSSQHASCSLRAHSCACANSRVHHVHACIHVHTAHRSSLETFFLWAAPVLPGNRVSRCRCCLVKRRSWVDYTAGYNSFASSPIKQPVSTMQQCHTASMHADSWPV